MRPTLDARPIHPIPRAVHVGQRRASVTNPWAVPDSRRSVDSWCRTSRVGESHASADVEVEISIARLRAARDKTSGITRDPNRWHTWADRPYNLIEHLCRLITVSVRTVRIVDGLPPSLPPDDPRPAG